MPGITYNSIQRTSPAWAQDGIGGDTLLQGGARLDAAQFPVNSAVVVTTTAAAAANATSIAVAALAGAIPAGTVLYFGETGELARLSSAAAAGATTLAVDALPSAIESGDKATYPGTSLIKTVGSGTPVGRTYAERDAGADFGPAETTDDEYYLLAQDVPDLNRNTDCELYRHGRAVRENVLPNWATLSPQHKAKIRALYECFVAISE